MAAYEQIAEVPGVSLQRAENEPLQALRLDVTIHWNLAGATRKWKKF